MTEHLLRTTGAIVFCCFAAGCGSRDVVPLGAGFEELNYTRTSIGAPMTLRTALQHHKAGEKPTQIWPSLYGMKTLIIEDKVIFVANTASGKRNRDGDLFSEARLFVAKGPELPLDITNEVLWRWSKQAGEDFTELLKVSSIVYPKLDGNLVEFHFVHSVTDGFIITVKRDEISDIMREVKEKGVTNKDAIWGTPYLEKELYPEEKK
ncbi:MAG: hypothetical protein HY301_01970 [Verrucomicrobia bacterium]|nr:hypothetical protein [Verrucomicrobiota bacterium]